MSNINITNIKPLYKVKKDPKVRDPIRIPNLIEPLEKEMKRSYSNQMNSMLKDITDTMIEFTKINRKNGKHKR